MTNNTGGPAFPETGERGKAAGGEGMTLRDYFAAQAMQGIMASDKFIHTVEIMADKAYAIADAMLKERNK